MDSTLLLTIGRATVLFDSIKSNEIVMLKLKISINGCIEALESYQDLSIEGESQVIESVLMAVDGAQDAVKKVSGGSRIGSLIKRGADRKLIIDAIEVMNTALDSLKLKITLAN